MLPQQQQQQQDEPPPLIPPPSHSFSAPASSSFASSDSAAVAPLLPLVCRDCNSPAVPACSHARCVGCCRQLQLHCPAHDSRPSLVGARFAAVLDGSVNGGLRLTAQLGDRIYRGVLFTGPAAVRIHRTTLGGAADSGNHKHAGEGDDSSGTEQQQQQQAAKRRKPASSTGTSPTAALSSVAVSQ